MVTLLVFLCLFLANVPIANATLCDDAVRVNTLLEKLSDGKDGIVHAYLYTTMQFPLYREATNLTLSALYLSGRANLASFRAAEMDRAGIDKIFRVAEVAHRKIDLKWEIPIRLVRKQFTEFIYHVIQPLGPVYQVLQRLHGEEFPHEWDTMGNDVVMKELFGQPLYVPAIGRAKIYGEAVLRLLFSTEVADISRRYRAALDTSQGRQFADDPHNYEQRWDATRALESFLVENLERLYPELEREVGKTGLKDSVYVIRSMMRDFRD